MFENIKCEANLLRWAMQCCMGGTNRIIAPALYHLGFVTDQLFNKLPSGYHSFVEWYSVYIQNKRYTVSAYIFDIFRLFELWPIDSQLVFDHTGFFFFILTLCSRCWSLRKQSSYSVIHCQSFHFFLTVSPRYYILYSSCSIQAVHDHPLPVLPVGYDCRISVDSLPSDSHTFETRFYLFYSNVYLIILFISLRTPLLRCVLLSLSWTTFSRHMWHLFVYYDTYLVLATVVYLVTNGAS